MSKVAAHPKKNKSLKNTKRAVIVLLVAFIGVVLIPTTALAYMGFVPGITELIRTNKPVDLGVSYSVSDFKTLQDKTSLSVASFDDNGGSSRGIGVPHGSQLVIFGANTKEASLTQEELTAFVNLLPWTESPLTNAQFRLNGDGTVEFSGNVKSAYVSDLIKTVYPDTDFDNLNPVLKLANHLTNPAIYLKASVSAVNVSNGPAHGQLSLKLLALKVNRIDLTKDVSGMNELKVSVAEGSYQKGIPYSLSSLSVSNGQLSFYGTIPSDFNVGSSDPSVICNNYHGGSLVSLNAENSRVGSVLKYCE